MFKAMSDREQVLYFKFIEMGQRIFTINDIEAILSISDYQASNVASALVKKGVAERIKGGLYARIPESVILSQESYREDSIIVASHLVEEYYLSHLTAMKLHGLSNAYSSTIYITTVSHQRNINYHGNEIRFVHTTMDRMFGTVEKEYFNSKVHVSDLERTIIDVIDRPNLSGGWNEIVLALKNIETIDTVKMMDHLSRFGKKKTIRIVGYLVDGLLKEGIDLPKPLIMKISGNSRLYMDRNTGGSLNKEWNLIVPDIMKEELNG
jgi:predicted transcriptional regulator of viral defense system